MEHHRSHAHWRDGGDCEADNQTVIRREQWSGALGAAKKDCAWT